MSRIHPRYRELPVCPLRFFMSKAKNKQQPTAAENAISIKAATQAFLESGGKITKIDTGVSGQISMAGPKHISLGNK